MEPVVAGFGVVGVVLLVLIAPLLLIWSLNTLFPVLAIPYEWRTWLAALIISLFIGS